MGYFAPCDAGKVLCVNAAMAQQQQQQNIAMAVELIGPEMPARRKYMAGGVLAPDGCVYFAPLNEGKVMCINQESAVEFVGPKIPWERKFVSAGALAPDGCIYYAPFNNPFALR